MWGGGWISSGFRESAAWGNGGELYISSGMPCGNWLEILRFPRASRLEE